MTMKHGSATCSNAETAVEAIRGRVRPDLDHDVVLVAAMERFVEIIGEAAGRISEERKEGIADVPWREIVGMRNRLIHGYGTIDPDILWAVVHDDLPGLVETLRKALAG